jgi:hypothetical protein
MNGCSRFFRRVPVSSGLAAHLAHEWVLLANLFLLLVGFALLAAQFEQSGLPRALPRILADDWTGGLALLAIVFVLSGFLDNIAAALIGGAIAHALFRARVRVGYLAAIVAAANAGGAGSVIGDTTTTMMWISGVHPLAVLHAYLAAAVAFLVFAIQAARAQQRFAPIIRESPVGLSIDWARVATVAFVLASAVAVNVGINANVPEYADRFPFIGFAVGLALIISCGWRRPDFRVLPGAVKGSLFLLCLVASASLMPVASLPAASWQSALALGFVSAFFDNIPLTALALKQGGYDWGMLAYAVGFGGSMIWFGSSAGLRSATCSRKRARPGAGCARAGRSSWHTSPVSRRFSRRSGGIRAARGPLRDRDGPGIRGCPFPRAGYAATASRVGVLRALRAVAPCRRCRGRILPPSARSP